MKRTIISRRFAVAVIGVLFAASALGWILTGIVPPDAAQRQEIYKVRWGDTALRLVTLLQLHDPFHAFWYRAVLAIFFAVLAACLATRWRQSLLRPFRGEPPEDAKRLCARTPRLEISWRDVRRRGSPSRDVLDEMERRHGARAPLDGEHVKQALDSVSRFFRGRGFRVSHVMHEGEARFAAVAGRWRHFGSFLSHLGILVIALGGMLGGIWGSSETVYGTSGDRLPLGDSPYTLLVEEFDILRNERLEVTEFVSSVSIVDTAGSRLMTATIGVNKPLHFDRYDILQGGYYVDEEKFRWARVEYIGPRNVEGVVRLEPDSLQALGGYAVTISARRFLPDLRIGSDGPYSRSRSMNNPALEVIIDDGSSIRSGWLFLLDPRFDTKFDLPVRLRLVDVAPVYYTGLLIGTNPGSAVLLVGIAVATAGLLLLSLFNYRCIKGIVGADRLVLAGTGYRWRASFTREFETVTNGLLKEIADKKVI